MAPRIVGAPSPAVSQVELDDELSLFDPRTGQAFVLNRTATDVWALADGSITLEELIEVLARAYQVPASEIRNEVEDLVEALESLGALETIPEVKPE